MAIAPHVIRSSSNRVQTGASELGESLRTRLRQSLEQPRVAAAPVADGAWRQQVDELLAAGRNKDEFLAVLGHELRNPLGAMRTALDILNMSNAPPSASGQARVIINRQLQNMTRLIDDMLDVARITQGKISLRLAPTDLIAVLRQAMDVVAPDVAQRDQELSVSLLLGCAVLGDTMRLEQAFGNLLSNASKFTKRGGRIWLTVEKSDKGHPAREVIVRVRDEGAGIAADMVPDVFTLFTQAAASPHGAGGLGIGLALVRRIVDLHHGRVSVESAGLDQGSEFIVVLPLLDVPDGLCTTAQPATH